jgi:GNAT superfamily N-acetyltransferase
MFRESPGRRVSANGTRVRIAALRRGDAEAVFAMLSRCSAATMYHRFHGVTDGISHATKLMAGAADLSAYAAWHADRCVGLASLALDRDGSTHIGVLVEDGWQRRGVGSSLMGALVDRARERRLSTLVADVLADRQFILPLLARIGPTTTSVVNGGYRVRVGLEVDSLATRSAVLDAFRRREVVAIRAMYRDYGRLLPNIAYRVLGRADLAEEAVQKTFVRAWQAADRIDVDRDPAPWLETLARRTAIDILRDQDHDPASDSPRRWTRWGAREPEPIGLVMAGRRNEAGARTALLSAIGRIGGERAPTGGGGVAGEPSSNGAAGPLQVGSVGVEMEVPVSGQQCPFELERQLPGIAVGAEFPFVAGVLGRRRQRVHPLLLTLGYAVADRAWRLAVELGHGGGEKTASGKDVAFDVRQKCLAQPVQPLETGAGSQRGCDDFVDVALPGRLDGGQLQVLHGAEVGEQPALAHP